MTGERFSLDTNILVHAADRDAGERHARACNIVERAAHQSCTLTLQALAEFFHAVTRKGIVPRGEAAALVRDWLDIFPTIGVDAEALRAALSAVESGKFSFWDALLLATAGRAGCATVLSEDMADGATLSEVVVRNPFVGPALPDDLQRLLGIPSA